jgi:hypothetical protein
MTSLVGIKVPVPKQPQTFAADSAELQIGTILRLQPFINTMVIGENWEQIQNMQKDTINQPWLDHPAATELQFTAHLSQRQILLIGKGCHHLVTSIQLQYTAQVIFQDQCQQSRSGRKEFGSGLHKARDIWSLSGQISVRAKTSLEQARQKGLGQILRIRDKVLQMYIQGEVAEG